MTNKKFINLDICKNCEDGDSYESEENYYKTITTGSDFSGVGAFDYAIERVCNTKGFEHERIFACDWDKFARITYTHNHGEPLYFPKDVYDRDIPEESLDIYMTSPPCQAFSLAGKRKGKNEKRGILFFNSHEFIKVNKPRFFIFENVKGLLSDDKGLTFQEWVDMLGGKSVNGLPVLFPHDDALDYHLYWQVLNSKDYGVPQNRERVFLIGIRDDVDNDFRFPKKQHLTKRLKDVLENEVDQKYFLSDKVLNSLIIHKDRHDLKGNGFGFNLKKDESIASTIRANNPDCPTDNYVIQINHSKIRRLTPRECFRLQDFPETFDFSVVSNSQAYKQAGNSITVAVLEKIISNLNL